VRAVGSNLGGLIPPFMGEKLRSEQDYRGRTGLLPQPHAWKISIRFLRHGTRNAARKNVYARFGIHSVEQTAVFEAAEEFARVEGILPAPESSHAIRVAMDETLKFKETGEAKTILFGLTGTRYVDMTAYQAYKDGTMSDYIPTDDDLKKGFDKIPQLPGNGE
jgi:tryptophan synthase beta chain